MSGDFAPDKTGGGQPCSVQTWKRGRLPGKEYQTAVCIHIYHMKHPLFNYIKKCHNYILLLSRYKTICACKKQKTVPCR